MPPHATGPLLRRRDGRLSWIDVRMDGDVQHIQPVTHSVMTLAGLRHLEEFFLRNGVERDHHELPLADVYLMRCVGLDHHPGLISSDRSVQDFVTEGEAYARFAREATHVLD